MLPAEQRFVALMKSAPTVCLLPARFDDNRHICQSMAL